MHMMMPYRRRRYPSSLGFPMGSMVSREMQKFDAGSIMKTDISQTDEGYELSVELPGFSKEDVELELKDGYLVVSAKMESATSAPETEEKTTEVVDEAKAEQPAESSEEQTGATEQTWIRRERFFGSCQRSFFMGEDIDEEGVTAKFENGLLKVSVPKKVREPEPEQKKLISIEG